MGGGTETNILFQTHLLPPTAHLPQKEPPRNSQTVPKRTVVELRGGLPPAGPSHVVAKHGSDERKRESTDRSVCSSDRFMHQVTMDGAAGRNKTRLRRVELRDLFGKQTEAADVTRGTIRRCVRAKHG